MDTGILEGGEDDTVHFVIHVEPRRWRSGFRSSARDS